MTKRYLLLMMTKTQPMPTDPKDAESMVAPWKEFLGQLQAQGKLEGSLPVNRDGKAVRKRSIKDYKAKTTDLSGYLVIKADSLEEAINIAQSTPHAKMNMGTTIVRECIEL
ncbi:MAG: hypothetical protein KGH64_00170 [Candidatus Micrarchaeota archaeon]|nr:hypothetical protein [Candidatus Micrarchaeota archaeon]MDE1833730.1 hypothetical protein [Candidatus Micrarchaeota archaeon]MDE1859637.1 hypothetical protein [Candidatus Micrarchaeota archaeon]